MIDALGTWLGTALSRFHSWWLRRRDRKLPRGFFGEDTQ